MKWSAVVAALMGIALSSAAYAHGGGLNAEGCHNNRKTGDYHCHRAPSIVASKAVPDQKQQGSAVNRVSPTERAVQRPSAPACYTGPRGGTYTITASGRKNYSGC